MVFVRGLISAVLLLASSISFAQPLNLQTQDLTDYLTPRDIMLELGVNEAGILWNASAANPRLLLIVDKAERGTSQTAQTLEAVLDGEVIHRFKVSTGKEARVTTPRGETYFATTPVGEYRIYARNRYHKSSKWNGAEMNFAQFFNGGIAIHATTPMHYRELGRRDSGGCVRLREENAETIWNLVGRLGVRETMVIVFDGSEQLHPLGYRMEQEQIESQVQSRPQRDQQPQQPPQQQYDSYPPPQIQYYPTLYPPPYPRYWLPSPNPPPPPLPPPGYRDSYPYCRPGFWCPMGQRV